MNNQTKAQRINARQNKIWDEAKKASAPETRIDVPDDGPDGFELPDGTETWIGSVPAQQPQHSPLPAVMSPEPTTLVLRSDLLKLNNQAKLADKLAATLKETLDALYNETTRRTGKSDSCWITSVKSKAHETLAEYQNAKGGENV